MGPPNTGKSTLMNRILGRKVAIVSPKPQTTRNRILGIHHGRGFQMVFMDTPGMHRARTALHRSMVASAREAFHEVDLVALLIDRERPDDPEVEPILSQLRQVRKPAVLVINKIDKGPRQALLPIIGDFSNRHPFSAVVPISALTGEGLEPLMEVFRSHLKPGPPFFPEDMHTDQPESFMAAEIIREKVYLSVQQEIPYSVAVTVDLMEERPQKGLLYIAARIHVETPGQKKILVGRGGSMIREVGERARKELEYLLAARVYLDLTVRVEKNWSRDTRALGRLGY